MYIHLYKHTVFNWIASAEPMIVAWHKRLPKNIPVSFPRNINRSCLLSWNCFTGSGRTLADDYGPCWPRKLASLTCRFLKLPQLKAQQINIWTITGTVPFIVFPGKVFELYELGSSIHIYNYYVIVIDISHAQYIFTASNYCTYLLFYNRNSVAVSAHGGRWWAQDRSPRNIGTPGFSGYEGLFVMRRSMEKCQAVSQTPSLDIVLVDHGTDVAPPHVNRYKVYTYQILSASVWSCVIIFFASMTSHDTLNC